ncbi:ABC transporter permease [Kaistia algarum]|uniref:ABC transporter permease n=1 Tax=Kaistia algarum TaxID=2083279 RepID=UPI000CE87685|nr:ABC transporter permease [Kaistia algarum]MCX5516404.1 ABC transporter permease [Kaistia algarum]PPE78684.1 ABC transporter permease [Kaistia algarum]
MSVVARLFRAREAGILVMLVLFVTVVGLIQPRFLTMDTVRIVLLAVPLIMVAAMGQMMVLVARHVDLSIGSILGFSAIAAGMVFRDRPDLPLFIGFAVAILCGAGLGFVNGLVVTLFRLPSIIVTLGTLSLYRGLLFILSGSKQIDPNDIPEPIIRMAQTSPIGMPWIVIIAFGVALATWLFLTFTQLGRQIYAIGSNPVAAPLRGIRVMPVTILVFTLSGALAGLAGIIYAARFGYVNPGITGVGFEFTVIAAVVIGGVSINGGVGSVAGTVLGVLFLGAVQVALPILGVSGFWQNAIYGGIILIALVIDRTVRQGGLRGLLARGAA